MAGELVDEKITGMDDKGSINKKWIENFLDGLELFLIAQKMIDIKINNPLQNDLPMNSTRTVWRMLNL